MADIEDSFHSSQRDIDAYAGESSRVSFRTLFIFNAVMFGVHLIVAIAIFVLSSTNENFESFRLPMRVSGLELVQPFGNETGEFIDSVTRDVGLFRVAPLTGVFSLLSAIFHLLVILPVLRPIYEKGIVNHVNDFRWIEYSLSASVITRARFVWLSSLNAPHLL